MRVCASSIVLSICFEKKRDIGLDFEQCEQKALAIQAV